MRANNRRIEFLKPENAIVNCIIIHSFWTNY